MPDECEGFKNNPVDIQDYEALVQENTQNCWNDGYEDGKADRPFNKDKSSACSEYGNPYTDAYESGCMMDSTDNTCELLIQGEKSYCPSHPDIQHVWDSYIMLPINDQLKQELVREWEIQDHNSAALKSKIQKNTV